jgi:hypothetical protein
MPKNPPPSETLEIQGKTLKFASSWGEVAGTHKHAETRVQGGGGGGTGGNTAPIHISSTVTVQQEFFLKTSGGGETPVKLSGADIPLRDGQSVTMVSVSRSEGNTVYWARLVNHAANQWYATSGSPVLLTWLGVVPTTIKRLGISTGIWWGTFMAISVVSAFHFVGTAFLVATGAAVYYLIKVGSKQKAACSAFDAHCQAMSQWALSERASAPGVAAPPGAFGPSSTPAKQD